MLLKKSMMKQDTESLGNHEKYKLLFNLAKRCYWLEDEKKTGNLERAIIKEYHLLFSEITNKLPLSEFSQVWNRLYEIRLEVHNRKKNDLRSDIKIKNVLDFMQD